MTLTAVVAPTRGRHSVPDDPRPATRTLLVAVGLSVTLLGLAVTASRADAYQLGLALLFAAALTPVAVGGAVLLRRELPDRTRRWATAIVALLPTILYRLTDPLLLTGFDEQLHLRTLRDLAQGAPLFAPNPLLQASPHFPGLELLTVALERATGAPEMVAVTAVVLLCRLVLALALYELGRLVTGTSWAASIVVLCYAVSPQFFFFNSQYAYQTLALSLAVTGVLLLARAARDRDGRRRRIVAALLCFGAVTLTHHLTSWITVGVLVGWAALSDRAPRRLIAAVAGASLLIVTVAAIPIAGLLEGYFGPMFGAAVDQVATIFAGGTGRTLFADDAGTGVPGWERVLLIGYAVVCTAAAVATGLSLIRRSRRTPDRLLLVLGLLCLAYPATFAGRLAPNVAEVCDRATTFAFIPLALGIGWVLSPMHAVPPTRAGKSAVARTLTAAGPAALLALLCFGFLGAMVLGSGPDWARLPGKFLAVADNRSLDSETLAAAWWSRDHLPPGSTVMADRMPATVLASTGRLWPQLGPEKGVEPATLYFAQSWGDEQTHTVRVLGLRYLYVDSRLAGAAPHRGSYFYPGETPDRRLLTTAGLTKYTKVPGIVTVYRHGPVAIYDLAGIQSATPVRGWTGEWQPHLVRDLLLGLLVGVGVAARRRWVYRHVTRIVAVLGGPATTATAMASIVLATAAATAAGFRPGWTFTVGLLLPICAVALLRRKSLGIAWPTSRPGRTLIATVLTAAVLASAGAALAVRSAWSVDVVQVRDTLAEVDS